MRSTPAGAPTMPSPEVAGRLCSFVAAVAARPDVQAAVEANHDENRWWPTYVTDWRIRMAVAGWSSRVSYSMVNTYSSVVARAHATGWDVLTAADDESLIDLIRPIGLPSARARYLRSLDRFLSCSNDAGIDLGTTPADDLISSLAAKVDGAGYNTAQCAVLYARGYHSGIIPVDAGMVTKLAPMLGVTAPRGAKGYEHLRRLLEWAVNDNADTYRDLASGLGYRITIPDTVSPTWFTHLVLIYFKRLYLNRPTRDLCHAEPACPAVFNCRCVRSP